MIELSSFYESVHDKEIILNNFETLKKINCEILKSGFSPGEKTYYYCNCDPNMKDPICEECMQKCHKDHQFTKQEIIEAICSCGMKSHTIKKDSELINRNYLSKCFFSELSEITKLNVYYSLNIKDGKFIYCMFCFNFCKNEKKLKKEKGNFIKKQFNRKKIQNCECSHKNHNNLEKLYYILNLISAKSFASFSFENLTYTHFINAIVNSPKTFKNLYKYFVDGMKSISMNIIDEKYQFEDVMDTTSSFYLSLENLSKLFCQKKNFNYLTTILNEDLGDYFTFQRIIERKFDMKQTSIWKIKIYYLSLYMALKLKKDINAYPMIKISDMKLLNPLQRTLIIRDIQHFSKDNLNLVELALTMITKLNREKEKFPETFCLISKFFSICKIFAKYSLFSNEQLNRFCQINDDLIVKFSEARQQCLDNRLAKMEMINYQFKILSKMVKSLTYIIYHYNDQYILSYLMEEIKLEDVKFYTTSDLVKKISKNAINMISSLRIYKQLETSFEKDERIEYILLYATDIVSISMTINEDYYSSMKRLMPTKNSNSELYLRLIRNNFVEKELSLHKFLRENSRAVEKAYYNYFNCKISSLQLCDAVKLSINEFFYRINLKNYDYTAYIQSKNSLKRQTLFYQKPNISYQPGSKNNQYISNDNFSSYNSNFNLNLPKDDEEKIDSNNNSRIEQISSSYNRSGEYFKFQILLNKNFYLHSLIKIIKIFAEENSSKNTYCQIEDSLFDSVTKILTFYIQDNPDNSMIFITSDFTNMTNSLSGDQQIQILDLCRIAVKNIQEEKTEMNAQCEALLDLMEDIVHRNSKKSDNFKLVENIIYIIKTLLKMPFVKKDKLIEKLRGVIKYLYLNNSVLSVYKNYLKESFATGIKYKEESESGIEIETEIILPRSNKKISKSKFFKKNEENILDEIISPGSNIQVDNNHDYIINIFTKFLKIVNNIFNGDSIIEENQFLLQIFKHEEVPLILKKKEIKIKLRTEILKFIRITNTDISVHNGKLYFYRSLIIEPKRSARSNTFSHEENLAMRGVFKLYQELININRNFDYEKEKFEFSILKFELKNFQEIFQFNLGEKIKNVRNYLERGVLFSIKIYMNKTLSCLNSLQGEDVLELYQILYYFLKVKEYILENFDFSKLIRENTQGAKNPFIEEFVIPNRNILLLDTNYILANKEILLIELKKDFQDISCTNFEIFNSNFIFNLFKKHFESITTRDNKQRSILKLFSKKPEFFSAKKIKKMEEFFLPKSHTKTHNEYEKRIFDLLIKYANDKNNFEGNKFLENLEEVNNYYYMKYRQQHIRNLLFLFNEIKFSQVLKREAIWNIFRLLRYDTIPTQKCFSELYEKKSNLLNFSDFVDNFFKHFLCVLFSELNPATFYSNNNYDYYSAIAIIKIFKYLCEEHNQIFQRIFFQEIVLDYVSITAKCHFGKESSDKNQVRIVSQNDFHRIKNYSSMKTEQSQRSLLLKSDVKISFIENLNVNNKNVTLFDFMLCILAKVFLISSWNEVNAGSSNNSFFYEIFFAIIEFLIEMVQGTEGDNLKSIIRGEESNSFNYSDESKHFSEFLISIKPLLFRNENSTEIMYRIKTDLIDFLMAFLEEKSTPIKLVTFMSSIIHPNNMIEAIVEVMKKLYVKENNLLRNDEIFDHKVYAYFSAVYFDNPEFGENPQFVLANRMYHYIKQLGTNEKFLHEDAGYILNLVNTISSSTAKLHLKLKKKEKNMIESTSVNFDEKKIYENYFCVKFFEKIIRTVFVQLEPIKNGSNWENKPVPIIFTLNPLIRYLSKHTRIDFYDKVDRNSRHIKLYSLMTQCDQFFYEVKYYSERVTKNKFLKFLNKINYFWLETFVFYITVIMNIIMISVLGPNDNVNGNEKYTPVIQTMACINIALNFLFICIWFYSKFQLYYMIERKHIVIKYNTEKISFRLFLKILFNSILKKPEINGFLWNLIICSIGVSKRSNNFAYSVQLFAIINLSETLKNIIRSIVSKIRQLTATLAFVFLLCFIFASIAFFSFSEDFIQNIFDPQNPEIPKYAENQCSSLVLCFLTHVDYGLRTDGGIGEYMNKRRSYIIEPDYYMVRFLYEDFFFILVIVILLSLVFGIIIDAFAELRDKYLKYEKDKRDTCFICGASREQLEKKCENFNLHVMNVHNMWTYADYIIGLKFIDIQETNAINSYVIEQVEKKQIAWLPVEEEDSQVDKEKNAE